MAELISVIGDPNTDGGGDLLASNNTGKVFAGNRKVVYVGSHAQPDALCLPAGPPHCDPLAATGSSKVMAEGIPVHRIGDKRACGALTVSAYNPKVVVG